MNGRRKINRGGRGLLMQGQKVASAVYRRCNHGNIRLALELNIDDRSSQQVEVEM